MSKYAAAPFAVSKTPQEISEKFSDLTALRSMLDNVPEAERQKLGNVEFETDSISIVAPQVGAIKFRVVERDNRQVKMVAEGSPIPIYLNVEMEPKAAAEPETDVTCGIEVNLPAMLRPMVAPHLQKAVESFSTLIKKGIE